MELHIFTFGAFYRPHKKPFGFTNVDYELAAKKTKHNSPIWKASGVIWNLCASQLMYTSSKPCFRFLKFPVR